MIWYVSVLGTAALFYFIGVYAQKREKPITAGQCIKALAQVRTANYMQKQETFKTAERFHLSSMQVALPLLF